MKIRFVLVAVALLAWCAVDGRPQPGTTGKKDADLDGIADDLADFLQNRKPTNDRDVHDVYSSNRGPSLAQKPWRRGAAGALQPPALSAAVLGALSKTPSSGPSDFLSDLFKNRNGQGGLGSLGSLGSLGGLGSLGSLTRPSNPASSVQYPKGPTASGGSMPPSYPSRPASSGGSMPSSYPSVPSSYPSRPASSGGSMPSSYPSMPSSYPSRPASNVPSYPGYPSGGGMGMGGSQGKVPAGGGWVVPGSGSTAPKMGGAASYPGYPSNYPSNYPGYPSYTNYQRGSPSPYPGYQQPASYPGYQQPAAYPGYQQTYPGYQSVQRYDPRNPPPPLKKQSSGSSISNFFKKIFT